MASKPPTIFAKKLSDNEILDISSQYGSLSWHTEKNEEVVPSKDITAIVVDYQGEGRVDVYSGDREDIKSLSVLHTLGTNYKGKMVVLDWNTTWKYYSRGEVRVAWISLQSGEKSSSG
ncbi:hypothetical protein ACKVWC_000019 [Pyricularia oryzae]